MKKLRIILGCITLFALTLLAQADPMGCGICTGSTADAHCEELAGYDFCQTIVPGTPNCNRYETVKGCPPVIQG